MAPDLSLAGVRLVIADHAMGLPVLRTLSLSTCRRQYPGVATGRNLRSTRPASAIVVRFRETQNQSEIQSEAERGLYVRPLRPARNHKAARPLRSRTRLARPVAT